MSLLIYTVGARGPGHPAARTAFSDRKVLRYITFKRVFEKFFLMKPTKNVKDLKGAHDKFLKGGTSRGAYMRQNFREN